MSNQQRVARAVKDLAQVPFESWRDWGARNRKRIVGYTVPFGVDPYGEPWSGGGEFHILVGEPVYHLTLRVQKPDIYDKSQFPQKTLLLGGKEVAHYDGKLNPVIVSVDLSDEMTDALVAFASDVKRELMARRS